MALARPRDRRPRVASAACALALCLGAARAAAAADLQAGPADLRAVLGQLQPGDTLHLAAGTYTQALNLNGLNGTAARPITITGPDAGPPAIFVADPCCNTIEISNASYLVLRNLTVEGKDNGGSFGLSVKGGQANLVHHIHVEGCTFQNQGGNQQNVAISTKAPTWGWVIRGNRILGAGTGLYLGNSDGTSPFIGGLIENNLVKDPIGYCMEIKWQKPRPAIAGMPQGPSRTIIRNNVFLKSDAPSPSGDRPNVLVGGFPESGPGAADLYEIYGNLFHHNPREALLQVSGRAAIHDNLFVDSPVAGIVLQNHDLPLKLAHVYNNTVYVAGTGIRFGQAPSQGSLVLGNLVLAGKGGITGPFSDPGPGINLADTQANAAQYVTAPSAQLGKMDFYPLPRPCQGAALQLAPVSDEADYDRDFNGQPKAASGFACRGAYAPASAAAPGMNPGWRLDAEIKPPWPAPPDGGPGSGADGGLGSGTDGAADERKGDGASGCQAAGAPATGAAGVAAALASLLGLQGRRRRKRR